MHDTVLELARINSIIQRKLVHGEAVRQAEVVEKQNRTATTTK